MTEIEKITVLESLMKKMEDISKEKSPIRQIEMTLNLKEFLNEIWQTGYEAGRASWIDIITLESDIEKN